jgi:uncharacterized RDD family membrane protein YckC
MLTARLDPARKEPARLDTTRPVSTPEGAEIELRVAGPLPRALAWALDALLRWTGYVIVLLPLSLFGGVGNGIGLLALFVGEWGYGILFEVLGRGATPGKRVLNLRVVHMDGTPVGWGASVIRNLMLAVDFLPPPFGAGLVSCLASRDFQRLGDRAAGTLVVHARAYRTGVSKDDVRPVAPPITLAPREQLALAEFATRAPTWTRDRRVEMAGLLEPLTGARDAEGVERLVGMAHWLEGRG